jgi:hypothetical protein
LFTQFVAAHQATEDGAIAACPAPFDSGILARVRGVEMTEANSEIARLLGMAVGAILVLGAGFPILVKKVASQTNPYGAISLSKALGAAALDKAGIFEVHITRQGKTSIQRHTDARLAMKAAETAFGQDKTRFVNVISNTEAALILRRAGNDSPNSEVTSMVEIRRALP